LTKDHNIQPKSEDYASNHKKGNILELPAVIDGTIIPIEEVEDQIFSNKMIGDGYGIRPTGKIVYSPINGKIEQIASTKHAICLSTSDNIKLLIHIGLDTIELKGKGFKSNIEKGMDVHRGDILVEIDPKFIIDEGYNPVIAVVILNQLDNSDISIYPNSKAVGNETIALKMKINN